MNRTIAARVQTLETTGLHTIQDMTEHERRNYSYTRALSYMLRGEKLANRSLEVEVSEALTKEYGITQAIGALQVPLTLRSGLDTKSGAAGGFTAGTDVGDLITLLRQKTLLFQLGAQLVTLSKSLAYPVQTSGSSAVWLSENGGADISDTDMVFGQRLLHPKTLLVSTGFTAKLLLQSNQTCEASVRSDLAGAISVALDQAGINGSGLENQPLGILGTTGIGDVAIGTNGGVPTAGHITNLELAVALKNADTTSSLAFLTTPRIRALLRQTALFTGSNEPLWQPAGWAPGAGSMLGYRAEATNAVPATLSKGTTSGSAHAIVFANFQDMVVGQFGLMSLLIDPYSSKKRNVIEVAAYLDCDLLLKRPESFAAVKDATLS